VSLRVPLIVFGLRGGSWADAMDRRVVDHRLRRTAGRAEGVFIVVVAGGPRLADTAHGAAAAVVGTTVAAAGGGALVVIGVVTAALAVPAFVRYRVDRTRGQEQSAPEALFDAHVKGSDIDKS
jgi:hypothetical protein